MSFSRIVQHIRNCKKEIYIWFRNDDVGYFNSEIYKLNNIFKSTPLYHATIPKLLDDVTITLLNSNKLTHVFQHGYSHINYSNNDNCKSEYPKNREITIVIEEYLMGNQILRNSFRDKFLDVFCPPWYNIDEKFSCEIRKHIKAMSFFDDICDDTIKCINPNIDIIDWKISDEFAGELYVYNQIVKKLEVENILGFILHHRTMGKKGFHFVKKLINNLKCLPNVRFLDVNNLL